LGSQSSFKLIDSALFSDFSKSTVAFTWLNEWISEHTKNLKPKLFVAGELRLVQAMNEALSYKKAVRNPVSLFFCQKNVSEVCQSVRKILKEESKMNLERALLEFRFAEEGNRAKKNIFQIARAVVKGRVRKLIVTDELSIFGKIDQKSGGIAIHPFDLDHEDDCILDDLAQMVLSQGGEVVIAKRNEIPKGRPILAILDDDEATTEKTEVHHLELLQERQA
jgi:hypothetical protein